MTFEGAQAKGRDMILQKFQARSFCNTVVASNFSPLLLQQLTFRKIQHAITCTDCQPLYDGSVFVQVLGQLKVQLVSFTLF